MKIAVVIPTYNGEGTLPEQLAALAAQSRVPEEVIVADNGSSDGSRFVASGFAAHLPLTVVDAAQRRGNAAARNHGAGAAHGDLLLFLDQDDSADVGWVAAMEEALGRADVVVGTNHMIFEWPPQEPHPPIAQAHFDFLPYGLSCNMGMTRAAFDRLNGFDETYRAATDVDLCWRAQLERLSFAVASDARVYKRMKTAGAFRQHAVFGEDDVLLFTRFRGRGMPRSRPVRRYLWLLRHLPMLAAPSVRRRWVRLAGKCWGRLKASVMFRTCYL